MIKRGTDMLADELTLCEARHLQALEGSPLDAEQEALFERMLREGWSYEESRAHLRARALDKAGLPTTEMSDPDYCYPPDFLVLRNRFGLRNQADLDAFERESVTRRLREPVPEGDFDWRICERSTGICFRTSTTGGRGSHRRDFQGRPPVSVPPLYRDRDDRCSRAA